MKKVFIELLLVPVAMIVFGVVAIIGILYTILKHIIRWDYSLEKQMYPILRSFNLAQDGFANAAGGEMLNDALKIEGKIRYGRWYQTISAVSGLIFIFTGKSSWLRDFLNKIDTNHCEKSVTDEDMFYWKNKNL